MGFVTEARTSIRESLRIFQKIEYYLSRHRGEGQLFEELAKTGGHKDGIGARSCGLTTKSFATLFFSKKQISRNAISLHTNGSILSQCFHSPNILLHGLGVRSAYFVDFHSERSSRSVQKLKRSLLLHDENEVLPRVIFINLSWVIHPIQKTFATTQDTREREEREGKGEGEGEGEGDESEHVKDHQFAIIKYSNESFKVLQGYIGLDRKQIGFGLSEWQDSANQFATRFQKSQLLDFIAGLTTFCRSKFNAESYFDLFGVYECSSSGKDVSTSVSFRELDDDSIIGNGNRYYAHKIERDLAERELRNSS